ncbi:MAG: hypothetical protein C0620_06745 [Desulfuromonas sp.]|nr:MAG: hypothetical protein C0620_06745 [Desulfuromonas sp.]
MTRKKSKKRTTKKKATPKKTALNYLGHPVTAVIFLLVLLGIGGYIISEWSLPSQPAPSQQHPQQQPPPEYPDIDVPPLPPNRPMPPRPATKRPRVAIIMDDIGINREMALEALQLDLPLALAIIPGEAHSTEIMQLAHQQQADIMIHIPMEPISYPHNDPGPLGLFSNQSTAQIEQRMTTIINALPYAVGGNNHMGSAFTQHADKLKPVLLAMKHSGLFFVDSLTSKDSVAYEQARELGLSCAIRDVFLDNVRDVDAILKQLDRLVTLARRNGSAIAICHPYPQTMAALRQFSQDTERFDIDTVSITQLVQPPLASVTTSDTL